MYVSTPVKLPFYFSQTLENGTNVIQLETAAGAAIQNFKGAMGKHAHDMLMWRGGDTGYLC